MRRRTVFVHFMMTLSLMVMVARIYYLGAAPELSSAADMQSSYALELGRSRGIFYDINMQRLTDTTKVNALAVMPTQEAAGALMAAAPFAERPRLAEQLRGMTPFVMRTSAPVYAKGVENFTLTQRYADDQIAAHLIGYTQEGSGGVAGLEQALNDKLTEQGGRLMLRCFTDALRRPMEGHPPEFSDQGYSSGAGVVLTLDADIQRIAENAARSIEKGCVVVMEVQTGDLKAMVSRPNYNPNRVADYLTSPAAPLINRALYDYAVGSSFKMLVVATALEQGIPSGYTYDCQGYVEIEGQRFHCHNRSGHGVLDMWGALQRSCNPYFVNLAQKCGPQTLVFKAQQIGFGAPVVLAEGYQSRPGVLPTPQSLSLPGQAANFSFGQGNFSATPLHVAAMVATLAGGGRTVSPRLVVGYTDDGQSVSEYLPVYATSRLVSPEVAGRVKDMLVAVVNHGSGRAAMPQQGGAGGKTASAQTGIYDEEGEEIIHAWFAGFFPADRPRYVVVVLNEGGDSGTDNACPIFKEIADQTNALMDNRASKRDALAAEQLPEQDTRA